jgi:hypothetical protein
VLCDGNETQNTESNRNSPIDRAIRALDEENLQMEMKVSLPGMQATQRNQTQLSTVNISSTILPCCND